MPAVRQIGPGVFYVPAYMSNVYVVVEDKGWFLIDTGVPGSAGRIRRCAEEAVGSRRPPEAIILTHGHFDHTGAVRRLADEWKVPVYAHRLELPFLTGRSSYPPPDPTVGGFMAQLSRFFPNSPIDLGHRVVRIPETGVPGLRWQMIHTPGHTPGHVSLFSVEDRVLIAGDAFCTVSQDSLVDLVSQKQQLQYPPPYFTPDWRAAAESVVKLGELEPRLLAAGHGLPLQDESGEMLRRFGQHFPTPGDGRYIRHPALFEADGSLASVPEPVPDPVPAVALGAALGLVAGSLLWTAGARRSSQLDKSTHPRFLR